MLGSHTFPSIADILDEANNKFVACLVLCRFPPKVLEAAAGAAVGWQTVFTFQNSFKNDYLSYL